MLGNTHLIRALRVWPTILISLFFSRKIGNIRSELDAMEMVEDTYIEPVNYTMFVGTPKLSLSLFKVMFQTNFAKSFKFLKNINVLGETCLLTSKLSTVFVIVAIQNN